MSHEAKTRRMANAGKKTGVLGRKSRLDKRGKPGALGKLGVDTTLEGRRILPLKLLEILNNSGITYRMSGLALIQEVFPITWVNGTVLYQVLQLSGLKLVTRIRGG